jgi:YD repeat-containing protein
MITVYAQTFARARLHWRKALIIALVSLSSACAASNPPSPGAPNPNAAPYPVLLTDEQGNRRQTALASWGRLMHEQGMTNAQEPELQPVTATIRSLPQLPAPLYLPKVGEGIPMTEEETRESLRRFINTNQDLLGIDPQQLSLVERVDAADGTKRARYQQRPFLRYNFRNGFGRVEITFTADRRILNISSTAIPEIERLRVAGTGVAPRAELQTAELVTKNLAGRTITYRDAAGRALSYTVTAQNRITARQFVVYPVLREDAPPALEFHLAWEIVIEGAPFRTIYLDAITNDILSASSESPPEL